MVAKLDQDECGIGMQNFRYAPAWDELCHTIKIQSPCAFCTLWEYLPVWSERNFRFVITIALFAHSNLFSKVQGGKATTVSHGNLQANIWTCGGSSYYIGLCWACGLELWQYKTIQLLVFVLGCRAKCSFSHRQCWWAMSCCRSRSSQGCHWECKLPESNKGLTVLFLLKIFI